MATLRHSVSLMWLLPLLMCSTLSWAGLTIEITKGADNPTPIAVAPFGWQGHGILPESVEGVIGNDLNRSGQFDVLPQSEMISLPSTAGEVVFSEWNALRVDYLVVGQVTQLENGAWAIDFSLMNILRQTAVATERVVMGKDELRLASHRVADLVYQYITGGPGAFATQVAYVSAIEDAGGRRYRLMVADSDGLGEHIVFDSREPIMSPAWSPDAQQLAYVSFELQRPAVFRHVLATGAREKLADFKGINSSPAWSPDGKKMALVLSKDGNPEIYILDLQTRGLTQITRHFAIDTEPSWTADGEGLIFTSSRGGKPQIYQYNLASGWLERLTFDGDYNARGRMLNDGKRFVFVHRSSGVFHIAVQDMDTGDVRVLTQTALDESPSVAPNGSMLMYATQRGRRGILGAVSIDGGIKFLLPSGEGDVREPAWSPYLVTN